MFQNGSCGFEHPQAACRSAELATENQHNAAREMDARDEMVAARREQQRLYILRNLNGRH
jgi:hypothetical protein